MSSILLTDEKWLICHIYINIFGDYDIVEQEYKMMFERRMEKMGLNLPPDHSLNILQ